MVTHPPVGATPPPFGAPLDVVSAKVRRARRLALRLWAVLGIGCLAAGSAYAAGLPTVGGTTDEVNSVDDPAARLVDLTGASSSGGGLYTDAVAKVADIIYTWSGKSASIGNTQMFFVDMTGLQSGTYAAEVVLTNAADMTGWWDYRLEVEVVPAADLATCQAHTFDGTGNPQTMFTDTVDGSLLFTGLASTAGGWCIGAAAAPSATSDSYFRRAKNNEIPTYPLFTASIAKTA
jgi:hypothetical protein